MPHFGGFGYDTTPAKMLFKHICVAHANAIGCPKLNKKATICARSKSANYK